jgi:hypothetical protein
MDFTKCEFLRNFPDVSRISNFEKLRLDCCKNLIEVHDSVGFLDKLVELSFEAFSNLSNFPKEASSRNLYDISTLVVAQALRNYVKGLYDIACDKSSLVAAHLIMENEPFQWDVRFF